MVASTATRTQLRFAYSIANPPNLASHQPAHRLHGDRPGRNREHRSAPSDDVLIPVQQANAVNSGYIQPDGFVMLRASISTMSLLPVNFSSQEFSTLLR
jgi:hypothetical protein